MAFTVKYRNEHRDRLNTLWRTDILEDGFGGVITNLKSSGNPINFIYHGDDEPTNQRILGSEMHLEVIMNSNFALQDIYNADVLQYKVNIYKNEVLYWIGWILPNSFQEPYDPAPTVVTIIASDGLGFLSAFNFDDLNYNTRTKISQVIFDILALVKINGFTEYVNIYSSTMNSGVGDSPFDQLGIDPDVFKTDDCYRALESIISTFNACIRQEYGVFTIYRMKELTNATMYGRIFTSGTSKTATTKTPLQYIKRPNQSSNYLNRLGGNVMISPAMKKVILNYDLGYKESILKHYDFDYEDFYYLNTRWYFPDWSATNLVFQPLSNVLSGEQKGILLPANNYATMQYIESNVTNLKSRAPNFKLSIVSRVNNTSGVEIDYTIHYKVKIVGASTKYWTKDGWSDYDHPSYIISSTVLNKTSNDIGWTDWVTDDIMINSIPIDGTLNIQLYLVPSPAKTITVAYQKVMINMSSLAGGDEAGIAYTAPAASIGDSLEKEMVLGDGFTIARLTVNQILNYYGIMNEWNGANAIAPSYSWHTRGNTENKQILELIAEEMATQFVKNRQLIDIPLMELNASDQLLLISNIQDSYNQNSGINRKFAITNSSFNERMREWELTLIELI